MIYSNIVMVDISEIASELLSLFLIFLTQYKKHMYKFLYSLIF